jgi:hypothetical protein
MLSRNRDVPAVGLDGGRLKSANASSPISPTTTAIHHSAQQIVGSVAEWGISFQAPLDGTALPSDQVERLRRRVTAMSDTGAALKKLADPTDPDPGLTSIALPSVWAMTGSVPPVIARM